MSVNQVNQTTGELSPIAGGTLYADAPVGSIVPFGGTVIPDNFLLCDGTAVSRTTYAELFEVIGTSFGAGDGSTSFNLPDLRGEFLRGAGTNSHTDQGSGGAVGEHQDATLHLIAGVDQNGNMTTGTYAGVQSQLGTNMDVSLSAPNISRYISTSSWTAYADSVRTNPYTSRPTNTSVNFIIKATTIALPSDFETAVDEKIAKDGVYSTTETKTNKVWIDGKPIYRKVVVTTSDIAGGGYIPISSNIDMLVDFGGTGYFGSNRYLRQFPWLAADYQGTLNGYNSTSAYYYSNTQTGVLGSGSKLWFEYTKTTD